MREPSFFPELLTLFLKMYLQSLAAEVCVWSTVKLEVVASFSLTYTLKCSMLFPLKYIGHCFLMEEELRKCALAAFEVPVSLNMAEDQLPPQLCLVPGDSGREEAA